MTVAPRTTWSPWRTVVGFGVVSLAADMVYEGARSVTGPYLASLGATALVVGLVTGAGEAAALVLRLVSGRWADRSGRYWRLTIAGYALTAVCVPLMAVAPFVGGAGLALACALLLLERAGKAVRSPAKSALLARVALQVGRGRGFAVHKALDQVGAFSGPLLVAATVAVTGAVWTGFALLVVPGVVAMGLLLWLRARAPFPEHAEGVEDAVEAGGVAAPVGVVAIPRARLPRRFYVFATSSAASTLGLMTFGILSFHLADSGLLAPAVVPVVYAGAMAAAAAAALVTGLAYDRVGARVLLSLPFLVAAVPALALSGELWIAVVGVLLWGAATGVKDSTVKALVADLVPASTLATAYGVFAAFEGAAALAGGGLAGWLYSGGRADLVAVLVACQAVSLGLLVAVLRR